MAINNYKCRICHQYFEIRTADDNAVPDIACPKCRSREVEKVEKKTGISTTLFPALGGRFT
ncbi:MULTISPECIES: FmdB family zinc ribbon protein [Desulfococcus]|jgi:putative FmdB family regulatory protein|uniref:Regulatory protein, FmdB family n=1 Tax=Desulfococcus multivorans DSM 2059 TaxID=1121405 RepID=S7V504_DESML|nr:FmdB family zinc ribbon protein [Desulfococcus multivorans]AOY60584.1 regulatory protein, FmdB family [Desulfococcus multivorans]AQV02680.1 hypothetical protein B2D07_19115 [Desulfococcus multivorans]EPR39708.1 regulatory protein, FmdB family [Desulfococcus multivorans DSM 2059]SKA04473.1 putative regulatory protein, FmdB family [Desulfococcus multivorans DSM 2059]